MNILLDLTEAKKIDLPAPTEKIKYIKKSDGKILEETVNSLSDKEYIVEQANPPAATTWRDYEKLTAPPGTEFKPAWPEPEFFELIDKPWPTIPIKPPVEHEEMEIPGYIEPHFGFGSVMGVEDTLQDIKAQEWPLPDLPDDYEFPDDYEDIEVEEPIPELPTLDQLLLPDDEEIISTEPISTEPISTEPISDLDKDELVQYTGNENVIVRTKKITQKHSDPYRHSYIHPSLVGKLDGLGDVAGGGWHLGDSGKKGGGHFPGHKTHDAGWDTDISIPLISGGMATKESTRGRSWEFRKVSVNEIDADRAIELIRYAAPHASNIFLDKSLIKAIKKRAKETLSSEEYNNLFKWKKGGFHISDEPNHRDHFHVRWKETSIEKTPIQKFEGEIETKALEDTELQKQIDKLKPERNIVQTSEVKDAPENYLHAYVFGRYGDATPLEEYNSDMGMYGASMQKIQLALANLIFSKQDPKKYKRLTDAELDLLLSYTERSKPSNELNKRLVSQISNANASKWLRNFNIQNALIRRGTPTSGSNKQSAAGYYSFINQLINYENHPYLSQHKAEAKAILDRINANSSNKRKYDRKVPGSYEGAGFENIRKLVNEELGYDAVESLAGKGGRAFGARNFSFIVDIPNSEERYMFTMYTQDPDTRGKKDGGPWSRYTKSDRIIAQKLAEMIRKHNIGNR